MENDYTRRVGRAAWLVYVDPKHEAGKLIQRITKGTLRATEAHTDGRRAEDDKYVEFDYELAVTLANATKGEAKATILKDTCMASTGRRLPAQGIE